MDEDEDEEAWDMELLVDSVRDPINRLFKMSTKIRNPSTRLGSSRAAKYRQVDEETGVELLQAMKEFDVDYVKSVFLEFQKTKARRESRIAQAPGGPPEENDDEVWEPIKTVLTQERERESTGAHSYLIDRIAQANFRRRQQFAYWAAHRNKLDKHTKVYQAQKGRLPIVELHKGGGKQGLEPAEPLPSISSATGLDMARLEISSDTRSDWALSEYAPSTRQAIDTPVDFPPAPKVPRKTQTDKFFECPYCFFLCPKDVLAEKAWKAHLIHDLRPYICTYEDCRNPTQLYDSRKDWVQHENSEHRKVWICLEHSGKVFQSVGAYKRHLQDDHAGSISGEESLTRIVQASESVTGVDKRTCPICAVELSAGRSMEGHVALHLERFARFSLPRSVINDDDVSNADSGKANRVDEEGSRDDDFEGEFELHSDVHSEEAQSTGRPPEVETSGPPRRTEATGDLFEDLEAHEDRDESSSSNESLSEIEESTDDEMTYDGLRVGEWCTDVEKYERVEREFRETLDQKERRLGNDHPDTLDAMTRLEDLLEGQRKFREAEQIARSKLERKEKMLGHEHRETWDCMNNLAHLMHRQENYAGSEQIHRRVLALREKEFGREDIDTLFSMSNLAISLSNLGHLEEAEKLGREAFELRTKVLGPAHDSTLVSMSNLADILDQLGRWEEAERLSAQVMEIHKQERGPDHPKTLRSLIDLAEVLWKQDKLDAAERLEMEVVEASKRKLGSTHPSTLLSMHNLAHTWHSQGRLDEATGLMEECVQLRRQVLGLEDVGTLLSMETLEKWRAELEQPSA